MLFQIIHNCTNVHDLLQFSRSYFEKKSTEEIPAKGINQVFLIDSELSCYLFLQVQRLQLAMLEMQQSQVQDTFGMTR